MQTQIPKEIRDYHEKIIFGLSIRQLGFTALALSIGIGTYLGLTRLLHLPLTVTAYAVVLLCAPFMALGFIRIHGYTFEQYLKLIYRHRKRGKAPRPYRETVLLDRIHPDRKPDIPYIKPMKNQKRRRKNAAIQEAKKNVEESC